MRGWIIMLAAAMAAGCDPVSISYRAATMAFMGKAEEELMRQEAYQKYEEKCLWPRFNAAVLAREAEAHGQYLHAAHYYQIAAMKGHAASRNDAARMRAALNAGELAQLEKNLRKHTQENLDYCWKVSDSRF